MSAVASLLAAMTIAGAFWVGVLAARRLRDWGDNSRALEHGEAPLALAAASGAPSNDDSIKKVRNRVAERLQASLENGTGWTVFEPNNQELWAKIKRNVNAFLTDIWRTGALFGAKPEQAFFVRCDESNNPPNVRDQGVVNIEIGLAVTKPAEFVVFTISQQ